MAGRKLTDRDRELRVELIETLVKYVRYCGSEPDKYTDDDIANMTKQVYRCAKTLGAISVSLPPLPTVDTITVESTTV